MGVGRGYGWALLVFVALCACRTPEPPQSTAGQEIPRLEWTEWTRGTGDLSAELPTVIALHGLGDRPESFLQVFKDYPHPVRVIAPRAPIPYGQGASWFRGSVREMNTDVLAADMRALAETLAVWIGAVQQAREVQGKPVVTGFSQGGMLSFALAVHRPDVIAGAVPLSGLLLEESVSARTTRTSVPVRALHGTADQVLSAERLRVGLAAASDAGLDLEVQWYEGVGHTITRQMRSDLYDRLYQMTEAQ